MTGTGVSFSAHDEAREEEGQTDCTRAVLIDQCQDQCGMPLAAYMFLVFANNYV